MAKINISKDVIKTLDPAPFPQPGIILSLRTGKVAPLGSHKSAINKLEVPDGPILLSLTGLVGDEHVYKAHGGTERALHQYNPNHYADWRAEEPPNPALFDVGGFGENVAATNMDEENVCVGDIFRIGNEGVLVEVSEPRNPCYKLNIRFDWPRALKRIHRTGRVGWNFRVLKTGYIQKGDIMELVERPNPKWSCMNVQRVIQGKEVPLQLLEECSELSTLTSKFRDMALRRLEGAKKVYKLTQKNVITPRIVELTFELNMPIGIAQAEFEPIAFAQIEFGPEKMSRSYSIVSGDLRRFSLGVALDDNSRGGSRYLHEKLNIGDTVQMMPGSNPKAAKDEKQCKKDQSIEHRIVIVGGIGITAFLPNIRKWEQEQVSFEIHYAARSSEDAAYRTVLPDSKTKVYSKSAGKRMSINAIIPEPETDGNTHTKIYCCGPSRMMQDCKQRTSELNYPDHMTHFEDFGSAPSVILGEPFEVHVDEPDTGRKEKLDVPADKSLLHVLREAGFDVMSSCQTGGCGACKITLCSGKVDFKSSILTAKEKEVALQSCVDRGAGKIEIEID